MPLQVFKKGTAYISDIIDAINYAKDMGAQIVNCSWDTSSQNQEDLQEAMDESGLLFVCAAGNSNKDIDVSPVYPASLTGDNIITVTSINKTGHLSYFSNYGLISVDVAAPGEEIMSTLPDNSYGQSAGTSQAAAFVSGQAALISSLYPELTPAQIKERIISSSDKLSSLCEKVVTAKLN
jgi:subtilisin family serine protease